MKRGRRNKKSKKRDETKKLYIPNGRKNIKYEVTHLAFEKTEGSMRRKYKKKILLVYVVQYNEGNKFINGNIGGCTNKSVIKSICTEVINLKKLARNLAQCASKF